MAAGRRAMFGEQQRFMLFLIAPAALLLLLFQVLPIAIGANASFRDWALYNPKKTWVGLDHYRSVITDPAFLEVVLPNTFIFMVLSVAGALVLGLALALLLNRPFRGQKIVQTVLLVPLMVAPVIAAIMMRWMFNDQFGIVNAVLEGLGLEGQPWLVERWSAFGIIVLTDIWLWTPWFTLLLLAGLQSLPKEPFEAAAIDGTSTWRVFSHLTLADAAAGHRGLHRDPRHRRLPHLRHRLDLDRRRARPVDRAVQPLRLRAGLPEPRPRPRLRGGHHRRCHHPGGRRGPLSPRRPHRQGLSRWRWSASR